MIDAGPSLQAARGVTAPALIRYLVATGWALRPSRVDGISILSKEVASADQQIKFILPTISGFSDEERRVADALRTVQAVERRPLASIVNDIQRSVSTGAEGGEPLATELRTVSAGGSGGPFGEMVAEPPNIGSNEIYIGDNDLAVQGLLSTVFTRAGYSVTCFADGAELVAAVRRTVPLCIILDVHISHKSGFDVLKRLDARNYPIPVIVTSAQGGVAMAVNAIKEGALDFIEKPFKGSDVVARVEAAIEARQRASVKQHSLFLGYEPLSRREQEVLAQMVKGASNKEAGRKLGISPRTVELHRANLMHKLGTLNLNAATLINLLRQGSEGDR